MRCLWCSNVSLPTQKTMKFHSLVLPQGEWTNYYDYYYMECLCLDCTENIHVRGQRHLIKRSTYSKHAHKFAAYFFIHNPKLNTAKSRAHVFTENNHQPLSTILGSIIILNLILFGFNFDCSSETNQSKTKFLKFNFNFRIFLLVNWECKSPMKSNYFMHFNHFPGAKGNKKYFQFMCKKKGNSEKEINKIRYETTDLFIGSMGVICMRVAMTIERHMGLSCIRWMENWVQVQCFDVPFPCFFFTQTYSGYLCWCLCHLLFHSFPVSFFFSLLFLDVWSHCQCHY